MFFDRNSSRFFVVIIIVSAVLFVVVVSSDAETEQQKKSIIDYHGLIEENAKENEEVRLNIPIHKSNHQKLNNDEVCGYTLYKWHSENPFKVVVLDRKTGEAKIVLSPGYTLNYEKKHRYNFEIAPNDCMTGEHGIRAKLFIKVEDVNEFAPIWNEHSYSGSVPEGKIVEEILQVIAFDADGSKIFSKICHYHLLTQDVPFSVSDTGYLGNTQPLKYDELSYYQLEVKAEDCGGLISDVVFIEIEVTPVCKARWTDIDDEVEVMGSTRQTIMPGASLDLCGNPCDVIQVSVTMEMLTSQIGRGGCDRDVYSLQTNRKICGASLRNVNLLPSPGKSNSWTQELPTDGGLEANPIFMFDGKTGSVEVPEWILTERNFGFRFSISTWMKREKNPDDGSSHESKEHILCSADAEGLNRHHSSLFLHNCRLILLLRQEPSDDDEDAEMLKPAEWRWMLPEVCDGKWHHYTINVNFSQVLLYLDGKLFIENDNNSETLEDWPLRQSVKDVRLVVGACWQGAKHRMDQYFRGFLTSLTFLRNETDDDEVIQCLNNCQEKLDVIGFDEMTTEMSVSMNSEMNQMTLNGPTVDSVEKMLENVRYVNSRIAPTPGRRSITIRTIVKCEDGSSIAVEESNVTVVVDESDPVNIILNSTLLLSRQEQQLLNGERIFQNLLINARSKLYIEDQRESSSDQYLLDSCVVQVEPRLNIEIEYLAYPENLTEQLNLEVDSSEDGLVIAGADRPTNYQQLLRLVQYITSKPQEMNSKTFILSCTELNGHFLSNQLRVTLEVIHMVHEKAPASHAMMVNKAVQPVASHPAVSDNMRLIAKSFPSNLKYNSQESGVGVAVVMVVCIGFVLMLIVLGIMRVRNAQRYKEGGRGRGGERGGGEGGGGKEFGDRKQDDFNNSLTITVNPMDPDNMYDEDDEEAEEEVEHNCSDSDDEDGIYSRSDVDLKKISNYGSIRTKSTLVL